MKLEWQVPYEMAHVKPRLVGYCPVCEAIEDPYPGPHIFCPGAPHDYPLEGIKYLLKRLYYRCPVIEQCDFYFPTLRLLRYHEHGLI